LCHRYVTGSGGQSLGDSILRQLQVDSNSPSGCATDFQHYPLVSQPVPGGADFSTATAKAAKQSCFCSHDISALAVAGRSSDVAKSSGARAFEKSLQIAGIGPVMLAQRARMRWR
jgi:hypothetical protein